jgi:putative RecB family exonuclease
MTTKNTQAADVPMALSHTRIKQFEACPMAYCLKYVEHDPATPVEHLESGIVVHRALELLVREAVCAGHVGPLDPSRAQAALDEAWATETAVGVKTYVAASTMLGKFVDDETDFDAARVLGIEHAFALPLGSATLHGVMDRVDRLDDNTIEIIDYKTGEMVPSADDLHSNLQLSLYQFAAQKLWPWAVNVKLTLHMVRHGIKLRTTRSPEAIEQAMAYARAMGRRITAAQKAGEYPARLSPSCGMCSYRLSCPTYAKLDAALPATGTALPRSLDEVATERERLNGIAKAAEARRQDLDTILRRRIDVQGEVDAGGRRYFLRNVARRTYFVPEVIDRVVKAAGLPATQLMDRLARVSNGELGILLKELDKSLPKERMNLLRAELEAGAERTYTTQLWSKPVPPDAPTPEPTDDAVLPFLRGNEL